MNSSIKVELDHRDQMKDDNVECGG